MKRAPRAIDRSLRDRERPWVVEFVRRRLVAQEAERARLGPSPRQRELDTLIAADMDELAEAFLALEKAVESAR